MINLSRFFVSKVEKAWNNRGLHSSRALYQNNAKMTARRQFKIFEKLLGSRKTGSKRRWFPQQFENNPQRAIATPTTISSTQKEGKSSNRRVTVLNKLFMKQITDLMATGSVSDEIVGQGIEISRVKVTPDFYGIDVFWVSKGASNDVVIEKILSKCAGPLRHELSQLKVMGEVPRIRFVKDKFYTNLIEVDTTLRKIDFGDDYDCHDISNQTKSELNLETCDYAKNDDNGKTEEELLPVMRHDVLGLNHKEIMDKILVKLKKSKQAWSKYIENQNTEVSVDEKQKLEQLKKLKCKNSETNDEEFQKFLQRRKHRSNLDHYKEIRYDEIHNENPQDEDEDRFSRKDDDDYIDESDCKSK